MKIRTKLTLLFFIISTIGLVILNAAIFYFVSEFNFEDFFKRLEARVRFAAQINIHPDERSAAYQEVRNRYLEKLAEERDFVVKLPDRNQREFKKPVNLPDKFYNDILNRGKARYIEKNRFYAGAYFNTPYGRYIVIATAADPYGFKELAELRRVLIIVFIFSVMVAYAAGYLFSNYTINPLRLIIRNVQSISANNLHMRLPEVKGKDEISEMVHTFNNMLNRLETSFETQNNFVSNASHELRTPLTIITSETELLLAKNNLPPDAAATAKTILNEASKLEDILASLLGLAQTGFDGKKQNWTKIRVDELMLEVVDSAKKIYAESNIDLDYSELPAEEGRLYTEGNIHLLKLALSNIVLNACKYSNNKPVDVKLHTGNQRIVITVTDRGIGIPVEEQQHIFEPFFRASNTNAFAGHGIGLPLTLNIIRLHNGTIGIRSEEQVGTEIQVLLPVIAS